MRITHWTWLALVLVAAGLLGSLGLAQDGEQAAPAPEFPPFDKVVGKEMETQTGLFPVYQTKTGLFAEMPVGKEFYLATSISTGHYRGYQWGDSLLRWDRMEKMLVLKEPNYRYTLSQGGQMQEAVNRTYPDTVLGTVPIVCMGPNGGPVIDLKGLLVNQASIFVGGIGRGDARLSQASKVKVFPGNVEIAMDLVSVGSSVTVHYSFSVLPQTNYQPRQADPRVGYFLTALKDFSMGAEADSNFVRYINRWHLEKEDPNAKVSPTKNPIVYYIEKTVPVPYRRYVREGIEEWNKAFEKVGLLNAIVVRQQTENNEFKDLDPEDVRYNFLRWITSETPFAMGPSRVNPRTGQILDADIIFDNSMVLSYLKAHDLMIADVAYGSMPPAEREFLQNNPQFDPADFLRERLSDTDKEYLHNALYGQPDSMPGALQSNHALCNYGAGKCQQIGMAALNFGVWGATEKGGKGEGEGDPKTSDYPEEFIGEIIKDIVMHEVGHTMGLRHNFKASSWRTMKEISGDAEIGDITASVMDYSPVNIQSKEAGKQGAFTHTTLGPYDMWAIEYGYSLDPKPEALKTIAARSAEPQLTYGTDEDAWSADPLIGRWDMGADPLAFAQDRMRLVRELEKNLIQRTVPEGESYSRVRSGFNRLLNEYLRSALIVGRFVGGQYLSRDHRGTPGERPPAVPVEATRQREALNFLSETVFSDQAFQFDPEILNKLVPGRWMHWGSNDPGVSTEFPVHDTVLLVQNYVLFQMLNPFTLSRVYDNELKVKEGEDALTLPELIEKLSGDICKEILSTVPGNKTWNNRAPMISSTRRNLQRQYIVVLISIALEGRSGAYPQSARTLAWHEVKRLHERVGEITSGATAKNLDRYSLSHLEECRELMAKALEASFTLR